MNKIKDAERTFVPRKRHRNFMKAVSEVSFYVKKFKESSETNTSVVGYQEVLKGFWPQTGLVDRQNW